MEVNSCELGGVNLLMVPSIPRKNKLLCKYPNTAGSVFDQLCVNLLHKRDKRVLALVPSPSPDASHEQVMMLRYMTALQPDTHRLSSCDLRSQRLSLVEWKQETPGLKQTAFSTPRNLRWQNEMDDMFGLNVALIGQRVPISVSSAGRLEEWKKNILSGDWELGQARNYMLFQIKVATWTSSKKGPSLPTQTYFSGCVIYKMKKMI